MVFIDLFPLLESMDQVYPTRMKDFLVNDQSHVNLIRKGNHAGCICGDPDVSAEFLTVK